MKSKWLVRLSIVAALLFIGVACGAAEEPTPTPTGIPTTLPTATATPTATSTPTPAPTPTPAVNPGKLTIMVSNLANERFEQTMAGGQAGGLNYGRLLHGFLISTNENSEMIPGIATDWGLSADGLTWIFTIREGGNFHDGTELTAEDVLWTFQHSFGPQAGEYSLSAPAQLNSRAMDKIEQTGPDEVTVITKSPLVAFAMELAEVGSYWWGVLPKRDKLHDEAVESAYDRNPIGAGPMRLVKHILGQSMTFERFDDYYYQPKNGLPTDKRVNFTTLDLVLISEEATRVAALRAGEADIGPVSLGTKTQVEAGGGRLVFGREGMIILVRWGGCWNPEARCADKRVRQALDYAIDKELMRDTLYGPDVMEVKGWTSVTPSTIGYTPELDPWPFDPDKARQLLADAGYKTPTNPDGKDFGRLILNTAQGQIPFLSEGAQLAADFWRRELGINVQVTVGDSAAIKKDERAGKLQDQLWWRDNETKLDASGGLASYVSFADQRYHDDEELRTLVTEAMSVVGPEREEALTKLYLRLKEEAYEIGPGYVNIPWGVGPRVATWRPCSLALYPSALHTITLK